jgi:hypothetical protein
LVHDVKKGVGMSTPRKKTGRKPSSVDYGVPEGIRVTRERLLADLSDAVNTLKVASGCLDAATGDLPVGHPLSEVHRLHGRAVTLIMRLVADSGGCIYEDKPKQGRWEAFEERIAAFYDWMKARGGETSPQDITDAFECYKSKAFSTLKAMEKRGMIARVGIGRYVVTGG